MRPFLIAATVLLLIASPAAALSTSDCLDCHSDKDLTKTVDGQDKSLYIDEKTFAGSVHGDLDCTDCHEDLADVEDEHGETVKKVQCANCHDDVAESVANSIHARSNAEVASDLPTCSDCHGKHDILPPDNTRSHVFALNIPATCCKCHGSVEIASRHPSLDSKVCSDYEAGMHGIVLIKSGIVSSAVCNDCHGSHDIKSSKDPASRVNRANVDDTCGKCHASIVKTYRQSVHGKLYASGSKDAPTCPSCHGNHRIDRAMDKEFMVTVTKRCSQCHPEADATFKNTYHGQVTGLGDTAAAQCPDCHGAHNILPKEDPASMINPDNLVTTCGKCHVGANENFVRYMPHADYHDVKKDPGLYYVYLAMVILLSGVFIFFGIHTILWFLRAYHDERKKRD
ncbi:MAG: hypothetical protein GXP52_07055 [Deltaproteobacteria bacterium]|nr:hypothetical protein [Deltaproteobacteria bacterium]